MKLWRVKFHNLSHPVYAFKDAQQAFQQVDSGLAFPEAVPEGERQVPLIVAQLPSRPLREFLQQLGQMGPKGGRFHGRLPPDGSRC